ncbi:hypothetical protein HC231_19245 [Brenneria izadpanahii]|uniref:Uncharacterized protein n=1 Tax=Brenneria izadpanahii TaxID=2722756 RepID=A0ABX7UW33_9GAMM|nr:hypothetical protein [Brenneria izadpanahii]QTF09819.1 hypothetical protein HC231_19245 [Brenneria izadpanahii]
MKYVIYLVIIVSTFWSWYAFPEDSSIAMLSFSATNISDMISNSYHCLLGMYKYTLPSTFWGVFVMYSYDFLTSVLKYNTPYMRELYKSCKVEVLILLILSLLTFSFFWNSQNTFTNSSIDIGTTGLSFMLAGNFNLFKLLKFKIGRIKYSSKVSVSISLIILAISIYNINILNDITAGRYNMAQSIWLQVTVLTYSLSLYFSSKHITYVIDKKKLDVSPVMLSLIKSFSLKTNIYENLSSGVDLWNKKASEEISKASAKLRKKCTNKKRK